MEISGGDDGCGWEGGGKGVGSGGMGFWALMWVLTMMSPEYWSENVPMKFEARCMHVAPRRMRMPSRSDLVLCMPMPADAR